MGFPFSTDLRYSGFSQFNGLLLINYLTPFENVILLLPSGPFKDCLQALEDGHTASGMFLVKPENANRLMQVWCDQRHDPGGWTVIQRRVDGSVNFFRNWETYKV